MRINVNFSISVLLTVIVALALAISSPAAQRHATLSLVPDGSALRVDGHAFKPLEKIVLRITLNGAVTSRTVRATAAGRFTTRLEGAASTNCSDGPVSVTATGLKGSSAVARHVQIAEPCGIASQP